jgi:hypothetical protein
VRCYEDYVLHKNAQPFSCGNKTSLIDNTFKNNVKEFIQENSFITNMAFDAHGTI